MTTTKIFWTERQRFGPLPRVYHAMAFDSARNRTVLFGGLAPITDLTARLFSDTWEWDGTCWTQMADIGPAARMGAAMAFDQTRGRLILFGATIPNRPATIQNYSAIPGSGAARPGRRSRRTVRRASAAAWLRTP